MARVEVGTAYLTIRPALDDDFSADLTKESEGALKKTGQSLRSVGKKATVGFTLPIVAGFGAITDAASDLNESVNVTDITFKDAKGSVEDFARGASSIGLTETAARGLTAQIGGLLNNMGFARDESASWSIDLATLGSDLGSAFNTDPQQAIEAISSALRGESEPIRKYNVTLDETKVAAKAVELGLASSTSTVSEHAKAQARLAIIFEQTKDAQGDYARTAGGVANATRTAKAEFGNLSARLGQQLLPIFTQIITVVGKVIDWFSHLSSGTQRFILIGAAFLALLGPAVTVIGALISPIGLVVAAIAALVAGIVYAYFHFQSFRDVVDTVGRWLRDVLWPIIQNVAAGIVAAFDWVVGWVRDHWPEIQAVIATVVDWLVNTAWPIVAQVVDYIVARFSDLVDWTRTHWDAISEAVGHVVHAIRDVIEATVATIEWIWDHFGSYIFDAVVHVWELIRSTIDTAIRVVRDIIQFVVDLINGDWDKAWHDILDIVIAVWDLIKDTVSTAINLVKDGLLIVLAALAVAWGLAWDGIKWAASEVWQWIDTEWHSIIDPLVAGAKIVWDTVTGAWDAVWQGIKTTANTVWEGIRDGFNTVFGPLVTAVKNIWHGVATAWHSVWSGIVSAVSAPISWVAGNVLKPLFHVIDDVLNFVGLGTPLQSAEDFMANIAGSFSAAPPAELSFARGGRVPGTYKGHDDQLAWVASGEYVVPADRVRQFGTPFFDAIRSGFIPEMPGYFLGGLVDWVKKPIEWVGSKAREFAVKPFTATIRALAGLTDAIPFADVFPVPMLKKATREIADSAADWVEGVTHDAQLHGGPTGPGYQSILDFLDQLGVAHWAPSLGQTTGGTHAANSFHYRGKAVDLDPSDAIWNALVPSAGGGGSLAELFFDPRGGYSMGQSIGAIGGHMDHLHAAVYDQGGVLPPGVSVAGNFTGGGETVVPPGTVIELRGRFDGERVDVAKLIAAARRASGRTTVQVA